MQPFRTWIPGIRQLLLLIYMVTAGAFPGSPSGMVAKNTGTVCSETMKMAIKSSHRVLLGQFEKISNVSIHSTTGQIVSFHLIECRVRTSNSCKSKLWWNVLQEITKISYECIAFILRVKVKMRSHVVAIWKCRGIVWHLFTSHFSLEILLLCFFTFDPTIRSKSGQSRSDLGTQKSSSNSVRAWTSLFFFFRITSKYRMLLKMLFNVACDTLQLQKN